MTVLPKIVDGLLTVEILEQMDLLCFGKALALLGLLLLAIRRCLLPWPIPGIPYDKEAANRILGDIPSVVRWQKETAEIWSFIRKRSHELKSPVFQLFMRGPFGKPWVVVTDFRESQDIHSQRQGEFDRSAFLGDVFGPLLPGNQVWMPSDEQFHSNRSLLRDTMSPNFLHNVIAPVIHESTMDLIRLCGEKERLSQGRPFAADRDIIRSVVDLIFLASLGIRTDMSKAQAEALSNIDKTEPKSDTNAPMEFPPVKESRAYTAIRTLVDSIQIGMSSPFPRLHMNIALCCYPSLVSAKRYTDRVMSTVLRSAWRKFYESKEEDEQVTCAADLLVRREAQMAQRNNRAVMENSSAIRDELFGFYFAGHETTSTTLCWAVKHLTMHQDVQRKLRAALRSTYQKAASENRAPSVQEIVDDKVPYLDAFIKENHRLGNAIPATIRRTMREAVVLGHVIPQGVDVFMMSNGAGFQCPAFPIEERMRSPTSKQTKDRYGVWDGDSINQFDPQRFLVKEAGGGERYNPFAGPVFAYGAGLRGCFGIKLATLELRVILTLIVWAFEFQPTPTALSSMNARDVNTHRAEQTYIRLKTWRQGE